MTADMTNWPWAQPAWERTAGALDTLHHGLLITGVPGIAKREFAIALSQLLLCDSSADNGQGRDSPPSPHPPSPCGQCRNCTLFRAGTHPDFHLLTTELEWRDGRVDLIAKYCNRYQDITAREKRANPGRVIPVDQVRLLIERFSTHAHIARRKVVLIVPADRMNTNAANALLKLLEEPPADSVLLLVSATPGYLPATVRSRCFQIGIPIPSDEVAGAWLGASMPAAEVASALELSNGGPVDALKLYQDGFLPLQEQFLQGITELAGGKTGALELAANFTKHDFLPALDWLHRFSCELIRERCTAGHPRRRHDRIGLDPNRLPAENLFTLYDTIGYYRKIARDQLNEQLAMEELALVLQRVVRA